VPSILKELRLMLAMKATAKLSSRQRCRWTITSAEFKNVVWCPYLRAERRKISIVG
jgi:hypothetical protein